MSKKITVGKSPLSLYTDIAPSVPISVEVFSPEVTKLVVFRMGDTVRLAWTQFDDATPVCMDLSLGAAWSLAERIKDIVSSCDLKKND